ncbi:MAG: branched-chain amino acid ABC transporter permease [Dictyoglomus sp. NZ13-RE01]|nr:MAG: branched-chain amino acid ABC transporter permease [Dictyoglomus sp. NZ13-RE01]
MAKSSVLNKSKNVYRDIEKIREWGILIPIILFAFIVALRNPYFLTAENIQYIFLDASILTIVAIGEMMVILTGGIDLSVGSTLALIGMIIAMFYKNNFNFPAILAPFMGIGLGIICGAINGLLVSKGKFLPIIATLSTMYIYRGLVYIISGGKWVNAHEMPEGFKLLTRTNILGIPSLIIFAGIIFIIFYYFLNHRTTGREIYAVGDNPNSAIFVGINKDKILFLVYVISGAMAGLGGVLYTSRFASAESSAAMGFELSAISAVVIGGVKTTGGSGRITGVLLGAFLLTMIINGLNVMKISPFYKLAFQGVMFLTAVIIDSLIAERTQKEYRRKKR